MNLKDIYTHTGHSIQKQQDAHYFQVHREHSPGQITQQATRQVSVNLNLKSYSGSFLTTLKETRNQLPGEKQTNKKPSKIHEHTEAKQYGSKQPMGYRKYQRGNKKIPRDK